MIQRLQFLLGLLLIWQLYGVLLIFRQHINVAEIDCDRRVFFEKFYRPDNVVWHAFKVVIISVAVVVHGAFFGW